MKTDKFTRSVPFYLEQKDLPFSFCFTYRELKVYILPCYTILKIGYLRLFLRFYVS